MKTITLAPKWSTRKTKFLIRGEGSDTDVIEEVITKRCYRKPSIGFEILPGEHWLDLGANIGAFAACCYLHGAGATCYEPESNCYKLLCENVSIFPKEKGAVEAPSFELFRAAVTTSSKKTLPTVKSNNPENNYRLTTLVDKAPDRYIKADAVPNVYMGSWIHTPVSGAKLDIEGSELSMIDEGLLPNTNKLVMEYHFSRDDGSMENFHRRMKLLRRRFKIVNYPPSLDKVRKGKYPGRFDINVFCKDKK